VSFEALDAPEQRPAGSSSSTQRPHRFGLGGQVTASNRGASGALRYWFGDRVGVDFTAGYFRARTGSTFRTSSLQVSPAVLVLLTDASPARSIDVRPYVGGGVTYGRTLSSTQTDDVVTSRASGTGGQVFGGVEMTFQNEPNLAISAETGYYRQPIRFAGSPVVDGGDFRVYVHYYLR
jgi:outer membrane protein W